MLCSYNEVFEWFTGDFQCLDKSLLLCWELICTRITYPPLVVVVILFPEEYNIIHSIHTTVQQFHKCIPLAVAREALWLIELTTSMSTYSYLHFDILTYKCIYRNIFTFHYFISDYLFSYSTGYTHTEPQTSPGWDIYNCNLIYY